MNLKFKQTIKLLRILPGVGPRQAARFILALLEKDESELRDLGNAIANLRKHIQICKTCFNLSEGSLCHICLDQKRDFTKLLVVEKVTDLESIEKTGIYKGIYHVLGNAINPLDGATPDNLRFKELITRIDNLSRDKAVELIIATNPTTTGETTALYIKNILKDKDNVTLTRLGRGLASGSNLEYADEITLKHALESRK